MKRKSSHSERGQSLVETVAALGVAVLVIGALVSLGVAALRSSGAAKNAAEARTLVNEEMELVRYSRDRSSWSEFVAAVDDCLGGADGLEVCDAGASCYATGVAGTFEIASSQEDILRGGMVFTRCFNYKAAGDDGGDGKAHIVGIVEWEDSRGLHRTVAETYLAEWE